MHVLSRRLAMKLLVLFGVVFGTCRGQLLPDFDDQSSVSSMLFSMYMQTYVEPMIETFDENISDGQCKRDLKLVYDGAKKYKKWALEMLDAWAKPQTGILTGNVMHTGNYDECLAIHAVHNNTRIHGQYCSAFVSPSDIEAVQYITNLIHGLDMDDGKAYGELVTHFDLMKASWGVCVPKSCTLTDLQEIWDFVKISYDFNFDVYFDEDFCDYEGKRPMSDFAIFTVVFLSIFAVIVILSTIYDIKVHKKWERTEPNLLTAFSAYTNTKKIFTIRTEENCLKCLNGIRVISMLWIIVGHRLILAYYSPHINSKEMNEWTTEPDSAIFISAPFGVDTFFLISGLLLAYLFLENNERGSKMNVPYFYLHRLLRLTPALAVLVLVFSSLISNVGSGPFWPVAYDMLQKSCERNWWATLLYVQNYVYPESHCVGHAWYLAVDTQLYFFSPLILIPLAKWPRKTLLVVTFLAIVSSVWVFVETWTKELGSTYMEETAAYHKFYISTHLRASPWLIGIIMGYVIHKFRRTSFKLNKKIVILMWILSLCVLLSIIFAHLSFTNNEYDVVKSSIFNSLSRLGWSLAISWIVFACSNGYGGLIDEFLSMNVFSVLIKLNYNMYLLHIIPVIYFAVQIRSSSYFNPIAEIYSVWSDVATTLVLAFVWTLAFESPIIAIERILFRKGDHKNSS